MRKILCLAFAALLLLILLPLSVSASDIDGQAAAEKLHSLGLLAGVGTNADGSVDFDTDGSLNRAQAITQVVRFLGAEKKALLENNAHPFSDLPEWVVPYVSYAYTNKLANGVSQAKFDSSATMSDAAFLTLVLRVLGYDDGAGDFVWNDPYSLAKQVGLISSAASDEDFTRGEAFVICYNALSTTAKDGTEFKDNLISSGVFTAEQFDLVTENAEAESKLYTIDELNTNNTQWSHVNDDINTASLENSYRDTVELDYMTAGTPLYATAHYPRVKKVKDDLYLLIYMPGQFGGGELYYATSNDGKTWSVPQFLWKQSEMENGGKFVQTEGPLKGKTEKLLACNPNACVLNNGEILAVYAIRGGSSINASEYEPYNNDHGVYIKRGVVNENNEIVWGEGQRVTRGRLWEPSIWQRPDGRVEIYWTFRGTSMIYSDDNGHTWTPDIDAADDTMWRYLRIYQEDVGGEYQPPELNEDGTYKYPVQTTFSGQMPNATELYNGKTLLALEVQTPPDGAFSVTLATSLEGGEWKNLGLLEDGTEITEAIRGLKGCAPFVDTFPSGEVYLTSNSKNRLLGWLVSPDGKEVSANEFQAAPDASAFWGSQEIVDSHKVLSVFPNGSDANGNGIFIYTAYLNHRININKASITVDGFTNDWYSNTDALFVGSECQAQVSMRASHDDKNMYFLCSVLDYYLTNEESVSVCVADSTSSYYRINADINGNISVDYYELGVKKSNSALDNAKVVVKGTQNDNSDEDEGWFVEIAVPKNIINLEDKSEFAAKLILTNNDGNGYVVDTFPCMSAYHTKNWPMVVLE